MTAKPVVGIPCCLREFNDRQFHVVANQYTDAVSRAAEAMPLLVPAVGDVLHIDDILDRFDGLLITGSPSNVEPHHYDGEPSRPGTKHDPARDATTLPIIGRAIERDMPILAICRGIQELNVAMGGSLHQLVHEVPGRSDHRTPPGPPIAERYAHKAHTVRLTEGGLLARLAGATEIWVNSLHSQGIDRLAPGLAVEAVAPDGQIEAVRLPGKRFALGVQWHPEAAVLEHPFSLSLFRMFGDACRAMLAARSTRAIRAA
jgi:putative glutamine amidotransferase